MKSAQSVASIWGLCISEASPAASTVRIADTCPTGLPGVIIDGMRNGDLREEGRTLLISCYELGHQPMGLAMPAAFLERAGFRPDLLDTAVEGFDSEKVERASFVGISVPMHTALRLGVRIGQRVRRINPECHICFFGLYASLNAEYLLEKVADSAIGGECEQALTEIVCALAEGRSPDVVGVATRGKPGSANLNRLLFPVPVRGALPVLDRYALLETEQGFAPVGHVEASRGCRHFCLHCPIPPVYEGRFFVVPVETVLEDVRRLVQMGARHITFGDPDFLNGPRHALKVVRAMHQEFPSLTFDFTAKIEHLVRHGSLLYELACCGCLFIVSAAESLSDTVLEHLQKGHVRADFFEALHLVRGAGLSLRPSLVSFTPWTTLSDYIEVLDVVEREDLLDCIDPIQYAVRLLIPPGSLLLLSAAMKPYLGPLVRKDFTYSWKHPDPRMDKLCEDVTALVKESVEAGEDPVLTFARIRELAESARAGREPDLQSAIPPPHASRPMRLTEPWFC